MFKLSLSLELQLFRHWLGEMLYLEPKDEFGLWFGWLVGWLVRLGAVLHLGKWMRVSISRHLKSD